MKYGCRSAEGSDAVALVERGVRYVIPTIAIACWSVVEKRSKARCLASAIALISEVIMPEESTAMAMSWSVTGRISPSQ